MFDSESANQICYLEFLVTKMCKQLQARINEYNLVNYTTTWVVRDVNACVEEIYRSQSSEGKFGYLASGVLEAFPLWSRYQWIALFSDSGHLVWSRNPSK